MLKRYAGALIGLAVGDALGTTVEFAAPGTFAPVQDMVGGGPFGLKPGQWTDDTSMMLCLAVSLIECRGFDPKDQLQRYLRWQDEGYWSSTGICFDIGNTVAQALANYRQTGACYPGPTDRYSAGNGSLMRLAPIPLLYVNSAQDTQYYAAQSSRTTHGAAEAVDACRYYAELIRRALHGVPKQDLLAEPIIHGASLAPNIQTVAAGSFKHKHPPAIKGSGYVVQSLEAALWAFHNSTSFDEGALLAVNLGDDADTTGAIYGQLAGAFYGLEAICSKWRRQLSMLADIERIAHKLFEMARDRT